MRNFGKMMLLIFILAAPVHRASGQQTDIEKAKEHNLKGIEYSNGGELQKAIDEFWMAFKLYPSEKILYNIAKCHENLKDYERAVDFYEQYLKFKPDAKDASEVNAHILELKQRMVKPWSRPKWPWIPIGIGSALLVTGGALAIVMIKKNNEAVDKSEVGDPEAHQLQDEARKYRLGAIITASVGAVSVIIGIVFLFVKPSEKTLSSVEFNPPDKGSGLLIKTTFQF